MSELNLEEVFKLSGLPTHTFVQPVEFSKLLVSLRTAGRGVVIEGPSGIGKTTAVVKAMTQLGLNDKSINLSARKKEDVEIIKSLPEFEDAGVVIVDDFHRLNRIAKKSLADYMKVIADEERDNVKLVIIGINKAGKSLIKLGDDISSRIDTIPFEANPDSQIEKLIDKGEKAMNISLSIKGDIVTAAAGGFSLA